MPLPLALVKESSLFPCQLQKEKNHSGLVKLFLKGGVLAKQPRSQATKTSCLATAQHKLSRMTTRGRRVSRQPGSVCEASRPPHSVSSENTGRLHHRAPAKEQMRDHVNSWGGLAECNAQEPGHARPTCQGQSPRPSREAIPRDPCRRRLHAVLQLYRNSRDNTCMWDFKSTFPKFGGTTKTASS